MNRSTTKICHDLLEQAKLNHFKGYDPFDGLNSRLFKLFPRLKNTVIGLAWLQFFKRSPINLRKIFGVPKQRNPKGVALFILGMLEEHKRTKNESLIKQAIELADWLLAEQCERARWKYACWGYHFDWKARAFFVPQGKPNVITTIYVAQALYALGDFLSEEKYKKTAIDAANFIVEFLYTESEGHKFFAYIPGETTFVHNASLWGAAWVGFAGNITGNNRFKELAREVAWQSVSEQSQDGSWVYGTRHHHQFIDGFHTGYNLEALDVLRHSLGTSEYDDAIARGLSYYIAAFIEADGTVKYYHNNHYPLDMHSVAQVVLTLSKIECGQKELILEKVIARSLDTLYLPKAKRFVYQKYSTYMNSVDYIRWTSAWIYYSFNLHQNCVQKDD